MRLRRQIATAFRFAAFIASNSAKVIFGGRGLTSQAS